MKLKYNFIVLALLICICGLLTVDYSPAQSGVIDTYNEDFDSRADNLTIHGVDSWSISQGQQSQALTQSSTTFTGAGNALKLTGATPEVALSRSAAYGDISPCWIEFIVNPGMGSEARDLPSGSVAAITFDYTGKIYAADGASWGDTGETFTAGNWYKIILKLNFSTHLYDIYIEPANTPKPEFIPVKQNLNFIDSSINSLSQIGFEGAYNSSATDDSYVEDLVVHFVDRVEIITASQTIIEEEVSAPITVQLQNAHSQPQTAWRDITLEVKSSSSKGEFSLDKDDWVSVKQITIPKNAQEATLYYKDLTTGKPIITVKEYPDRGWEEAIQQARVVSKAAYFDVVVTTPQVAGQYFTMEIIAKDENGEVNEFYSGTVSVLAKYISPQTGTKKIEPESVSVFSRGKAEVSAKYPDCGAIEIMVEDTEDQSNIGTSGDILFIPAEFTISSSSPQVVNKGFQFGISAFNTQGEITPNYQGPVGFSILALSPDKTDGALSPARIEIGEFSAGSVDKTLKFNRWGTIKIKAYDVNYPEKSEESSAISFTPSGLLVEAESPPSGRNFYYVSETIKMPVSAVDEDNNAIANYQGLVSIDSTLGLSFSENYQFVEADKGKHTFLTNASSPGIYEVSVHDPAAELTGNGPKIEVKAAYLEVVSTFAPVGTAEVVIKLVDEDGNIISSENNLTLMVTLEEEKGDSSATSSAAETPVTFRNGIAKILVSNTQAEVVTILPSSSLDFKVKKGSVTFGRITKTGVGALMWREIKR